MPVFAGAVLIVAPPTLHRQGLLLTLQQAWPSLDFILTADAGQAPELLRHRPFRLVVVDGLLTAPPPPRLLELLALAGARQPMLLLTGPRLSTIVRRVLRASHPLVLFPYHSAPEALVDAIAPLLWGESGGALYSPRQPAASLPPTAFSRRELEVLRLIVADCCNLEIARQLSLSVRTVESHRRALLQKTGAKTLIGLAVQAVRHGWLAT